MRMHLLVAMALLAPPLAAQSLVQRRLRLVIGPDTAATTVIGRCLEDRADSLVLQTSLGPIRAVARREIASVEVEELRRPGQLGWRALPGLGIGAALGLALGSTRPRSNDVGLAGILALPTAVIGGRGEPAAKKVMTGAVVGGVLLGALCVAAGGGIGGCGDNPGEQLALGAFGGGVLGADIGAVVSLLSKESSWRRMPPDGWRITVAPGPDRLLVGLYRPL